MVKFKHTQYTSFVLSANIDGKLNIVEFRDGGNPPFFANATLTTSDEKLIGYIRSMEEYGKTIVEEETEEAPDEEDAGEKIVYDEVTTVQAAKDILVEKHGVKVSNLPNKGAILSFAAENNILFPNLPA